MTTKLEIPTSTIIKLVLTVLGLVFLYYIRDVLILLFVVLIIVSGLTPIVDRWSKYLTRPGAVFLVFLLIFAVIAGVFSLIIPPFIDQLQQFSYNLPFYIENLTKTFDQGILRDAAIAIQNNISNFTSDLGNVSGKILSQTLGVISGIVALLTIMVLSFYLLLEKDGLKRIYKGVIPEEWYEILTETTRKIANKLGAWLRGHLLVMLAVGVFTTIALFITRSPYALALGVLAGAAEVLPIIGPWIATITGVIVGVSTGGIFQGVLNLIAFLVVQQIEGNILVPKIMSKAVGLNPVLVIIAIIIGAKIYGILGIILAVPLAAVIGVIAQDWTVLRDTFARREKTNI